MPNRVRRTWGLVATGSVLAGLAFGCSANEKDPGNQFGQPDSGTGIQVDVGNGFDAEQEGSVLDPDAACAAVAEQATVTPVNLYVMYDKSSSMGPTKTSTKWAGARNGLKAFVDDPGSAGLRIALNFFPHPTTIEKCKSDWYIAPVVPFDVLPKNAGPIVAAVDAEEPNGFQTPMYPALGGAIRKLIDEIAARPGEAGAVLLVTDGEPAGPETMCGTVNPEDPAVIAGHAATGLSKGIKTFVVGLPGVNVSIANQIAVAGGTTAAILATDPTNVEKNFKDALATVRGKTLPCEFPLPTKVEKGEVSFGLVNVAYSKGGAPPATTIPQDPACKDAGWRYDDASKPTKIVLCPKTCEEVRADPKAKIDILLGCKTEIK